MNKRVILIFQDCPDCGEREEWYRSQRELAKDNHITIQPMPYNAPGIKDIILGAREKGFKNTLLFYTDGKKCAYDIRDFIKQPKRDEKADEVDRQN